MRVRLFAPGDVSSVSLPYVRTTFAGVPLAPSSDGYIVCPNVVRINHTHMRCALPEGDGAGLDVEVLRSYDGAPSLSRGVMSYDPPVVLDIRCTAGCDNSSSSGSGGSIGTLDSAGVFHITAPTTGGAVLQLTGVNFGFASGARLGAAPGTMRYCAYAAWAYAGSNTGVTAPGAPVPLYSPPPLQCDGALGSVGEGELSAWRLVNRSQTAATITVPGGIGHKLLVLSIGGNVMRVPFMLANTSSVWSSTNTALATSAILLAYASPSLLSMNPSEVGTDGDELVILSGASFGVAQWPTGSSPLIGASSLPTDLEQAPRMPTACMVVAFHHSCISDCLRPDGSIPNVTVNCAYSVSEHVDSELRITSGPGIGTHRNLSVYVVDIDSVGRAAAPPLSSSVFVFNYLPPSVQSVDPRPMFLSGDPGAAPITLTVQGSNMGRVDTPDYAAWSPAERTVEIVLGGVACPNNAAQRITTANSQTLLQCPFDQSSLLVGPSNLTIAIAGQTYTMPASDQFAPLIACMPTFVGGLGESCIPCPLGATCQGCE